MSRPSIGIIGAGVVGLSLARSLSSAGADVTVFERDRIGADTSSRTFAWVNSNGKSPESYHELNIAGMREHEQLPRHDHHRRALDPPHRHVRVGHGPPEDRAARGEPFSGCATSTTRCGRSPRRS